jgi:hypothetical protein
LLPVNSGGHTAYQNFVVENLSKYYPNPDAIARSTWDIIDKVLILFRILTLPSCFLILPTMQCLIMNTANVQECREGHRMNHDGSEPCKYRIKFKCPLASRKHGCSCEHPCSESKYGRTVHLAIKDNPDCSICHLGIVINGKLSIMQELMQNVRINVRN